MDQNDGQHAIGSLLTRDLKPRPGRFRLDSACSTSGLPFSTKYVASSAPLPVPTFLTEWTVPAGMKMTSPMQYDRLASIEGVLEDALEPQNNLFAVVPWRGAKAPSAMSTRT